ncbi:molybdenum cofactor guanylyltransferase [Pseudomonas aeruginosa]|nr:molybdenum cofactor guanylyltransferase [Pseudomonas aeruginosa]
MGGRDKGLIEWQGLPLIAHLHRLVRPLTDDLIVSCNRNQERYAAYADRLVSDDSRDFPGPLAGIRAGLAVARHPWLLVLPLRRAAHRPRLAGNPAAGRRPPPARPWMLRCGGQWEPLFSLIPTHLAEEIEHAWRQGDRSPRHVLLPLGAEAIELAAGDPRLANLHPRAVG